MTSIFFQGLFLGASLIIAIGIQNAFILRQGIKRIHVFPAVITAALVDAILIAVGVLGFGYLIEQNPGLIQWVTWGGVAFLAAFGLKSLLSAFRPSHMDADDAKGVPRGRGAREIVVIVLGISVLNPHVYLDTVVLVGGLSATHGEVGKYWFGAGAIASSFIWFYALGYGARLLTPLFAKPRAWQILDILIAFTMWGIALSLLLD